MINAKEKKVTVQLPRVEIRLEGLLLSKGHGRRECGAGQRLERVFRAQPVRMTNRGSGVLGTRRAILGWSRDGRPTRRDEEREPTPGGTRPSRRLIN